MGAELGFKVCSPTQLGFQIFGSCLECCPHLRNPGELTAIEHTVVRRGGAGGSGSHLQNGGRGSWLTDHQGTKAAKKAGPGPLPAPAATVSVAVTKDVRPAEAALPLSILRSWETAPHCASRARGCAAGRRRVQLHAGAA